jgi:hypothetical protein
LKTHARNLCVGGIVVPVALTLAAFIANESQMLLGLELDRVSLALYLMPFLLGAAAAIAALLHLEATKIGGELGKALGDLGDMFGPGAESPAGPIGRPGPPAEFPTHLPTPPPPDSAPLDPPPAP